jgi:hypothetical protein
MFQKLKGATEQLKTSLLGSKDETSDKEKDSVGKLERSIQRILNAATLRYKEFNLDGSVYVSTSLGPFSTAANYEISNSAEISELDEADEASIEETDHEELTRMQKVVMSSIDACISHLVRRSKSWKSSNKKANTSLSSGISVSEPFFGAISFTLSLTVTCISLANHANFLALTPPLPPPPPPRLLCDDAAVSRIATDVQPDESKKVDTI